MLVRAPKPFAVSSRKSFYMCSMIYLFIMIFFTLIHMNNFIITPNIVSFVLTLTFMVCACVLFVGSHTDDMWNAHYDNLGVMVAENYNYYKSQSIETQFCAEMSIAGVPLIGEENVVTFSF